MSSASPYPAVTDGTSCNVTRGKCSQPLTPARMLKRTRGAQGGPKSCLCLEYRPAAAPGRVKSCLIDRPVSQVGNAMHPRVYSYSREDLCRSCSINRGLPTNLRQKRSQALCPKARTHPRSRPSDFIPNSSAVLPSLHHEPPTGVRGSIASVPRSPIDPSSNSHKLNCAAAHLMKSLPRL